MSVFGLPNASKHFCFGLVYRSFVLSISESKFRRLGLPNQGSYMEGIAKVDCSRKSFLMNSGIDLCRLLEALGTVFLIFRALKTDLKIEGILVL